MNRVIQGTQYPFDVHLVAKTGLEFNFADSQTVVTWKTRDGTLLLTQTLSVDEFGVETSDGVSLANGPAGGLLTVTLTPAQTLAFPAGIVAWTLTLTDTAGDTEEAAHGELLVAAPGSRVDIEPPFGTSRLEVRRMLLARVGDLKLLRATANGATKTFIDAINLTGENNAYVDRQAYFAAGTPANVGLTRRVDGSSKTLRSIGFGLDLPAATQTGDEVELINTRGIGFTIDDAHQAINSAMVIARTVTSVPIRTEPAAAFDADAGTVAVPWEWSEVSNIQWQDEAGAWRAIRKAPRTGGDGWSVDPAMREVIVGGRAGQRIDGRPVRLFGYSKPAPLHSDTDRTPVNPDWLVAEAIANLLDAAALSYPSRERERAADRARRDANGLRYMLATHFAPNTVKLP